MTHQQELETKYDTTGLPRALRDEMYRRAYEEGHAYGLGQVTNEYADLVDLVSLAVAAPKRERPATTPGDIIAMARAAKSFCAAAADDDTPTPSDELFIRAAVAFSMLMRKADIMPEMAVIVPDLDGMNRDHAIVTIALNFSDAVPTTKERAALFSTVLPNDYAQALQEAVARNRRALDAAHHLAERQEVAFDTGGYQAGEGS